MKKILIVDDSEVSLFLLKSAFEDDKFIQIIIENDSKYVFNKLKKHKPNVLLLDLRMPNIDGFQLIHQIKSDQELSKLSIIVISAFLSDFIIKKLQMQGIKYYFTKPLELEKITKTVKKLL